jgi:putative transposase
MLDVSKDHEQRALFLPPPKSGSDLLRACLALTHQAKNLYNTGIYLIRQVASAYDKNQETGGFDHKSELHQAQQDAIAHFNAVVESVNEKRKQNFGRKRARAEEKGKEAQLKLLPVLTPSMTQSYFTVLLDETILDNALRSWPGKDGGTPVYQLLAAVMAQQVRRRVLQAFKGSFAGLRAYKTDPSGMTGRPGLPGYRAKHGRFVLEIPLAQVARHIPRPKDGSVVSEDDFVAEPSYLTEEMLAAFYGYNLQQSIADAAAKRGWPAAKAQHLRIVPLKRGVRFEVVLRIPRRCPEGSPLAKLIEAHREVLAEHKTEKQRNAWLLEYFKAGSAGRMPRVAGADLGVNNLLTLSWGHNARAQVHIGGRYEKTLARYTTRLAARQSALTNTRCRELHAKQQALREAGAGQKLSRAEAIELRTLTQAIFQDEEIVRLTAKRNRWTNDYLHKLSTHVVRSCLEQQVEVLVLGRNKLWKQEVNLGAENNRTFCQMAHAQLINLLRYKAEQAGIIVVETEEAYTSKASFMAGDEIPAYKEVASDTEASPRPVLSGRRGSKEDRNWFFHRTNTTNAAVPKRVHADVNASCNIIRKVFHSFRYHAGRTMRFTLLRLSPSMGVVPVWLGHGHRPRPCPKAYA